MLRKKLICAEQVQLFGGNISLELGLIFFFLMQRFCFHCNIFTYTRVTFQTQMNIHAQVKIPHTLQALSEIVNDAFKLYLTFNNGLYAATFIHKSP